MGKKGKGNLNRREQPARHEKKRGSIIETGPKGGPLRGGYIRRPQPGGGLRAEINRRRESKRSKFKNRKRAIPHEYFVKRRKFEQGHWWNGEKTGELEKDF